MVLGRPTPTILVRIKCMTVSLMSGAIVAIVLLALFHVVYVDGADQPKPVNVPERGASVLQYNDTHYPTQAKHFQQFCYGSEIEAFSPVPWATGMVSTTFSGVWPDTCVPKYQFHQVIDNVIRIYAEANPLGYACATVLTGWAFSVEVGPLPGGTYTVEAYISRGGGIPSFCDRTSITIVPLSVSILVPAEGGELTLHYISHTTSLIVPPGALSAPSVFTISYDTPPAAPNPLQGMNHFFDLTGTQTTFTIPLTLTVHYSESARGVIISGTESLYRWQDGQWVTIGITLTDRWSDGLSAQTAHLSLFGVLGETNKTYLPIILKSGTG